MAMVPQNVILKMALPILDPPVFAASAPRIIKNKSAKPYREYTKVSSGINRVTKKGNSPPTVNAAPEANAA